VAATPAHPAAVRWPFADRWDAALTWEAFLADAAPAHRGLWESIYRLAKVPAWAPASADALPAGARLVALSEDWCGDAVNALPIVAKWAAAAGVPFRILKRDEHPDVMDRYLTGGTARAIPVVIALAGDWMELGWWGPRPSALQAWVKEQRGLGRTKQELYPEIRRWYARDKGESTLREVVGLF
jgi:hypothetical protein